MGTGSQVMNPVIAAIQPTHNVDPSWNPRTQTEYMCVCEVDLSRNGEETVREEDAINAVKGFFEATMPAMFKADGGISLKPTSHGRLNEPMGTGEWAVLVSSISPNYYHVKVTYMDRSSRASVVSMGQVARFHAALGGVMTKHQIRVNSEDNDNAFDAACYTRRGTIERG